MYRYLVIFFLSLSCHYQQNNHIQDVVLSSKISQEKNHINSNVIRIPKNILEWA